MSDIGVFVDELGPMSFIAEGGQGRIHGLTHFQLPDCPGGVAYKEFKAGAKFVPAGVESIVHVRSSMNDVARRQLDRHAVWPLRVVRDRNGVVTGLLMPLIPNEYLQIGRSSVCDANGDPIVLKKEREIQYLFIDPSRNQARGFPCPNLEQRLRLCRSFAEALEFLARQRVVFGDISAKNALFKVGPSSDDNAVLLVDCDAARVVGSAAGVTQLNSPDWEPPDAEQKVLTIATDIFKFGLFVIRALSPGKDASTARDPARLDPILESSGRNLLRKTLSVDPQSRPAMSDWVALFDRMLTRGVPTVMSQSRSRTNSTGSPPGWVPKRSGQGISTRSATGSMSEVHPGESEPGEQRTEAPVGWRRVDGVWQKAE